MTVWATDGRAPEETPANRRDHSLYLALRESVALALADAEIESERRKVRRLDAAIEDNRRFIARLDAAIAETEGK